LQGLFLLAVLVEKIDDALPRVLFVLRFVKTVLFIIVKLGLEVLVLDFERFYYFLAHHRNHELIRFAM
jgi:hypothetical protein